VFWGRGWKMVLETLAVHHWRASVTAVATSFVFIVQEVLQMSRIVPPSANRLPGTFVASTYWVGKVGRSSRQHGPNHNAWDCFTAACLENSMEGLTLPSNSLVSRVLATELHPEPAESSPQRHTGLMEPSSRGLCYWTPSRASWVQYTSHSTSATPISIWSDVSQPMLPLTFCDQNFIFIISRTDN
jgi:hypothetical protein